jgi:tetratricopeptide (TPR) repeat protein
MGRVLMRMGRFPEALEQLEKVHAVVKEDTELNRALGKLYLQLGNEQAAQPLLESVLAKDPFDFEIRNLLTSSDRRKKADEAAEVYRQAVETGDQDTIDLFNARPQKKRTVHIDQILSDDEDAAPTHEERAGATDKMLDGLADKIMATLDEGERRQATDDIYSTFRKEARDYYGGKEKDLHAAAVLAQIHMEVSLLDEALHFVHKLLKDAESDGELLDLQKRLDAALNLKEEELDRAENMDLTSGV